MNNNHSCPYPTCVIAAISDDLGSGPGQHEWLAGLRGVAILPGRAVAVGHRPAHIFAQAGLPGAGVGLGGPAS